MMITYWHCIKKLIKLFNFLYRSVQNACSYFSVEDINRESPARDPEDGCVVKETGEALSVQSGAGHQHLQVWSEPGDVLNQTEQDVCVERSLVGLIDDDHTKGTGSWIQRYLQLLNDARV